MYDKNILYGFGELFILFCLFRRYKDLLTKIPNNMPLLINICE